MPRLWIFLIAALGIALLAPSAQADVITVDTLDDDADIVPDCELREAIQAANTDGNVDGCMHDGIAGTDTINIEVAGTITLNDAFGQLEVPSSIEIAGLGQGTTTITQPLVGRIFHVDAGGGLRLSRLTISGGQLSGDGPGILNEGELTLDLVTVEGNSAIGEDGGGIAGYRDSSTTITNSAIRNNVAGAGGGDGDGLGGGIFIQGGDLTVQSSRIYGNSALEDHAGGSIDGKGGGIFAWPDNLLSVREPTVTIGSSDIGIAGDGNFAEVSGGGLSVEDGDLDIRDSAIVGNTTEGGDPGSGDGGGSGILLIDSTATPFIHQIQRSLVADNQGSDGSVSPEDSAGGGIFSNVSDTAGGLVIEQTTFSGNFAEAGGAALFYGNATLRNSTLSANSSLNYGGGVVAQESPGVPTIVHVVHSTIAQNETAATGGAVTPDLDSDLTLHRSVLHNSDDGGDCGSLGPVMSGGRNVVSDASCALMGPGGDFNSTNPMLGALADNGGPHAGVAPGVPIETHALLPGSPPVDLTACFGPGSAIDQRGFARPFGSNCDAGAFEYRDSDGDGLEDGIDPTPFGVPSTAPTPSLPSNALDFGKVKRKRKKGIAFVIAFVPGPGQVGISGKGIKNRPLFSAAATKSAFTPGGRVKLKVKPTKKGKGKKIRKRLRTKGKAKVKVRVTYLPNGGFANTRVKKFKLIRK